jgi:hypothetical protein
MGCRMPTPGKSFRRLSDAYPGQSVKRRRFSVSGPPPLFSGEGITYHRIPVFPDGLAWLHGWVISPLYIADTVIILETVEL